MPAKLTEIITTTWPARTQRQTSASWNPALQSHAVVSLRPITDANREAVEALAVTPDQGRFVSGVHESILEAAEEPDAQALYWAISMPKRRRWGS
jgi:hypothetical protein